MKKIETKKLSFKKVDIKFSNELRVGNVIIGDELENFIMRYLVTHVDHKSRGTTIETKELTGTIYNMFEKSNQIRKKRNLKINEHNGLSGDKFFVVEKKRLIVRKFI